MDCPSMVRMMKSGRQASLAWKPLGHSLSRRRPASVGGVVACSYVGKLLLERCHLLSPHPVGEGILGIGRVKGDLFLIRLALDLVSPFEGGLGHLLSQYGSEFGGEAVSQVFELRIAGNRGDGEIQVKEVFDKRIVESKGDL